jgi:hypothetical protein
MRKLDRPIAAAVPGTLLPRTIQVLNLDISIFGFALNNSSKKFGVSLEVEMGSSISLLSLMPPFVLARHSEIFLLLGCACPRNSLGRFGESFIHFLLEGEQLLDARALLHALEVRGHVGEA